MPAIQSPEQQLTHWINDTKSEILLFGYDEQFMNRYQTVQALTDAINRQVKIKAMFPRDVKTVLDDFQQIYNVRLQRTSKELNSGFILLDSSRASLWEYDKDRNLYTRQVKEFMPQGVEMLMSRFERENNNNLVGMLREY